MVPGNLNVNDPFSQGLYNIAIFAYQNKTYEIICQSFKQRLAYGSEKTEGTKETPCAQGLHNNYFFAYQTSAFEKNCQSAKLIHL